MLRPARNYRFHNMSTAVLIVVAILVFPIVGGGGRGSGHFVSAAHAQSNIKEIEENIREFIRRWRGGLPEGIAGTNGRIEATEIDVSSKYAGRLASVMVDEGDEVKAGQVICEIGP